MIQYLSLLYSILKHPIIMKSNTQQVPINPPPIPLAQRMKSYESAYSSTLPHHPTPRRPRLFKFHSPFHRPFHPRIHSAILATRSDLLHHFPTATVAYTQSDEITLVFPSGVQA